MTLAIGLIGRGRMGGEIAALAPQRGHRVAATFHRDAPLMDAPRLQELDVLIDFSAADAVAANARYALARAVPLVIGTTGWRDELETVRQLALASETAVIHAANFSIGMHLFFRMAEHAAEWFNHFEEYDPYIHEAHHRGKADHPSGTALALANILLDGIDRKSRVVAGHPNGPIAEEALQVTATRAGAIPGTHRVAFDGPADTIALQHTARNRHGFALGALRAAEWIVGKRGFYSMDDLLAGLVSP